MNFLKKLFSAKEFSAGDIFYTYSNNQYYVYKLLVYEKGTECYHVLSYKPTNILPLSYDITMLEVSAYHLPIHKNGFESPVFLTHKSITADDLIGYHEYLKQTREPENYVPLVNQYYMAGLKLTDERKYDEAIDSYSKAIDLMPVFFEAIDNRAFCKMDIGRWEQAIEDFKLSLQVNPKSLLAEFSIGECYFKMGDYIKAKEQFEVAREIDPQHPGPIALLKKIAER